MLTYSSHILAEEALHIFKTPTRLYNQNYRVFVNREVQAMWSEPFYDLLTAMSKETRFVILSSLPQNVSTRQIEEEISCFGSMERMRRYSDSCVLIMRNVSDGKNLLKSGGLLVDGKKWKFKAASRLNEDPVEPDLFRHMKNQIPKSANSSFHSTDSIYELSVLHLSTADRGRLFEVIQSSPAFPCTRDSNVKGMSVDLLNKAKKLLQQSRKTVENSDYLLGHDNKPTGYDMNKKQKIAENKYQDSSMRYQGESHQPRMMDQKYNKDPPAYMPYVASPIIAHSDRSASNTPDQIQNLTMEQKMQYYYILNNPSQYYNPYGNYGP